MCSSLWMPLILITCFTLKSSPPKSLFRTATFILLTSPPPWRSQRTIWGLWRSFPYLILLVIGPDDHTASQFPSHLLLAKQGWWVIYLDDSPKPPPKHVTFSFYISHHAPRAVPWRRNAICVEADFRWTCRRDCLDLGFGRLCVLDD